MTDNVKNALATLENNGILARNDEEAEMLELFRKLPASARMKQLARMDGFLEAFEIKSENASRSCAVR